MALFWKMESVLLSLQHDSEQKRTAYSAVVHYRAISLVVGSLSPTPTPLTLQHYMMG